VKVRHFVFIIAQDGIAQDGAAQVGTAQVGTAQVGTAQDGIAQDGTAQVGTAQARFCFDGSLNGKLPVIGFDGKQNAACDPTLDFNLHLITSKARSGSDPDQELLRAENCG
jgi:hypothetical protein